MMIGLVLLWLALGLVIGALAIAARLGTQKLGRRVWLLLPGIGATAALLGGVAGSLVFSLFYGTATAAWGAVLGVVVGAWALTHSWRRTGA